MEGQGQPGSRPSSSSRTPRNAPQGFSVEAKIQEYWIANLVEGMLEVLRKPRRSQKGEWSYAEIKRVKPNGSVQPLGAPGAKLKVSDLIR